MNETKKYFQSMVPFRLQLQGDVNDLKFVVKGIGTGDASNGSVEGEYKCESGQLPLAWPCFAMALGYGAKSFINYPDCIRDFYTECMPQGYTQERVTKFENDGTLYNFHTVTMEKGEIIHKVTLKGTGFKPDSNVLNRRLGIQQPTNEYTYPIENGLKSVVYHVFPYIDRRGFVIAEQTTICKPLGGRKVKPPAPHHTQLQLTQLYTQHEDETESIIQKEVAVAYMHQRKLKIY